jgi:hypothetical protein
MWDLNLRAFEDEKRIVFECLADDLKGRPDLRRQQEDNVHLALSAWRRRDLEGVFAEMQGDTKLPFVFDNILPLKLHEFYEEALLHAYTRCRTNFASWPTSVLRWMFGLANRRRLVTAGDMWPGPGPYKVYRGVSGRGRKRRVRGFSWTLSFDKARWFATRYGLEKPMIYEAEINEQHVLAYYNKRGEQEFLCDIPRGLKLRRLDIARVGLVPNAQYMSTAAGKIRVDTLC